MATTRLLFAGCGAIARHHLRALQASGRRWEVSAVADPNSSAAEALVRELPQPEKCKVGGAECEGQEECNKRPCFGQNASCTLGGCLKHRPRAIQPFMVNGVLVLGSRV